MLEIKNVYAGYGEKQVLEGINTKVSRGCVTAVIGPNGCGKSTLLKTICGIIRSSAGEIRLKGELLTILSGKELAQRVAYLPQERRIPDITVGELVLHGRFPYLSYPRYYREADHHAAQEAMRQMQIEEWENTLLCQLSGGQRQKAYIAMVLAQATNVILLDEPATYLDINCQLQMLCQARSLAKQGKYVIMVSHDLTQAMTAADKIILLENGRIKGEGTPEEIYRSGLIDSVFGVKMKRIRTEKGWHYYYEEMK